MISSYARIEGAGGSSSGSSSSLAGAGSRSFAHGSPFLPRASLARAAAALFAIAALILLAGHTESSEHASAAVQYVKSSTQKYVGRYCPPGHDGGSGGGGGGRTNPLAHTVDVLDSIAPEAFDDAFIHVAVDERAGYHSEVWPAFVYTLSRLPGVRTSVFLQGGEGRPRANGMQDVIAPFWGGRAHKWGELVRAMSIEEPAEQRIDVLISTTCASTLQTNNTELLDAWDARDTKFRLVCVVHHAFIKDLTWMHTYMHEWAKRDSLVLIGLADHTTAAIKRSLGEMALKQNFKGDTSYAGAPVHTLVPVFPVPDGVAHKRFNEDQRPGSAVIQGKITAARRDYQSIFKSLMREIEAEPRLWGWRVPVDSALPYEPDPAVSDPFTLVLLGMLEQKDFIPARLKNVARVLSDVDYATYYDEIHNSGLVIPAFKGSDYYGYAASSSIAAAVIARTPVLATRYHLSAYTYLDQRGVVLVPDNVDPIAAIGRLRRPGHGTTLTDEAFWQVEWREEVRAFSWPKTTEESDALSEKVYRGNMRTMDRILRQPLPDYGYLVDYSV